jgi:putative ABC transport system permease protein
MLVYLRLLKESFAFAMDALRSNMLRTLLSLRDYRIFSIIAVPLADSLEKISKDLSGLDKNTIYWSLWAL